MNRNKEKNTARKEVLMRKIKSLTNQYNKNQVELGELFNLHQGRFSNLMDSDNYTNKFSIDKLLSYLDTLGVEVIFDLDKNDNLTIKTKRSVEKSRKKNIEILNSIEK